MYELFQVGFTVPFKDLYEVLSAAASEVGLCLERIGHPAPRDDPETHLEDLENNMTTFLYLTVILSRIIKVIMMKVLRIFIMPTSVTRLGNFWNFLLTTFSCVYKLAIFWTSFIFQQLVTAIHTAVNTHHRGREVSLHGWPPVWLVWIWPNK